MAVRTLSDVAGSLPSDVGTKLLAIHHALKAAGIGHAFGGAIALDYAILEPRATRDIDINIAAPVIEVDRVLSALPEGIYGRAGVQKRIRDDGQDRLRWGDVPVDLFFPQHEFHHVVATRARPQPFRGESIDVISATDLTVFKAMFNREKDWPDIRAMLEAGAVDGGEALHWLEVILGADHPSYARLSEMVARTSPVPDAPDPFAGDPNVWKPLRPPQVPPGDGDGA